MQAAGDKLFRAAALKQLNSPEQLDRLVRITRPIGWVAGFALAAMVAAAISWSILGRLPQRVPGTGIIISQGGRVLEVQSRGTGVLLALLVNVGDSIRAGQLLARLGETDGERDIVAARAQLVERQRDLAQAEAAATDATRLRTESLQRQRDALDLRLRIARSREAVQRERLETTQALFAQRIVTRNQLIASQNELLSVQQELSNASSDAARLGADEQQAERLATERLAERRATVSELERRIVTLAANLEAQTVLLAPNDGVVVEVRSQPGALVRQGQALLALEQRGSGYEVLSFVSSGRGKELRPGMEARVALSSARREEYGMLIGTVASVSEFPLSLDAVRALLQNTELANTFVSAGPPFLARVHLREDPASASGYLWTSQRGGEVAVSSGILANVEIVTQFRRPIALVIPALRRLLSV